MSAIAMCRLKLRSGIVSKWQTRKSSIQCASNRRFIEIRTNAKSNRMNQGRSDRNDTCAKSISIFRVEVHNEILFVWPANILRRIFLFRIVVTFVHFESGISIKFTVRMESEPISLLSLPIMLLFVVIIMSQRQWLSFQLRSVCFRLCRIFSAKKRRWPSILVCLQFERILAICNRFANSFSFDKENICGALKTISTQTRNFNEFHSRA